MKPLDPTHTDNYPAPDNSEGSDWRQACPRCSECGQPIDEDVGCQDADCLAEQLDEAVTTDIDTVLTDYTIRPGHTFQLPPALTVAQVRAAILDVIDAGSEGPNCHKRAWCFYLDESDEQTDTRMRFVDAVQARLQKG